MVKASVLLLTYNQEKFVADALISILKQDYENLEIIVSDDNSQDQTWQIIQDIASNHPKKDQIILNKNTENLGVVGNYYKAFNLSSGDLIFTAAGDDISLPNRCSSCIDFWLTNEKPDLIAADGFDMSIDGINLGIKKTDSLEKWDLEMWHKKRPYFFGASHMMTRKLISLNTLDHNLPYEDQCFVLRALMLGAAKRLPAALVYHRRGGISQPDKTHHENSKRKMLLKGIVQGYTELRQMLEDSKLLNQYEKLMPLIGPKYLEYLYGYKMLTTSNKNEALKLFITFKGIKISKKIRYLNYAIYPTLMQLIYLYKKKYGKK
jgi:glycosyltransferase involved in cell wall biosynthesis